MNTSLNRRDFLKVSGAAGTGLLLNFSLPVLLKSGELPATLLEPFEPNAFLRIDPSGAITVTVAKSEMGQGVLTSLPMIVAEELEADWQKVRCEQASAHPNKYGSQGTGGSNSVRGSYERLRKAGAAAREMLVAAAAQKWNVPVTECFAETGSVIHRSTGKKFGYGDLANSAGMLPVPENPTLKDPKDFKIIGKRMKKLDTPSKVNGSAIFGIDVKVPGMLYATVARSPVFGGTVAEFDATKAKQVPGVKDVVQIEGGIAVLATNTWAAIQGRAALSIRWDEGKNAELSSNEIWKRFEETAKMSGTVEKTVGDPAAALRSAATNVEGRFYAPLVAHATMEPMNCVAHVKADECIIWAPTQSPQGAQREAARVTGLPPEKVTVHVMQIGGGFGRRLSSDFVAEAVRVARTVNAPVKVVWTRDDDMMHDLYRPCTYNELAAGLDKSGSLVAWTHRIVGPNSKGLVVSAAVPEYEIPNYSVDYHLIETGVPIGAWRSVGPSQNIWIVESFVDECAAAAKKDPLAFRLQMLNEKPRVQAALKLAAEKAGWGKPLPKGHALGMACCEDFGTVVAEVAEVSLNDDERPVVHRIVVALDCGQVINPDTIEAQVEGAIVYGLSAALYGEITVNKGRVEQENFDTYPIMRIDETPKVEVHVIRSAAPIGGIGEPGVPPAAPAVCNALFALTGVRIRKLPIRPGDLLKDGDLGG